MKSSLLTEHKNKSTTDNQWEFLRLVAPPQAVIHIGAGTGKGELHQWRQWEVPYAVLIEADEARLDWANSSLAENPQWHTACVVLSDVNAEADFYTASNPAEDGLIAAEQLRVLWPNLSTREQQKRQVQRLDNLLQEEPYQVLQQAQTVWTIIDCLTCLAILKGAGHEIEKWSVLCVRVLLKPLPEENTVGTLHDIEDYLLPYGYRCIEVTESNNPAVGSALFVRDWQAVLLPKNNQLSQNNSQLVTDKLVLQQQLLDCQAANDALTQERDQSAKVAAERQIQLEELTKAKVGVDQEKTALIQSRDVLSNELKATQQVRDQQAQLAVERQKGIDALTQERDQFAKQVAERQTQLEALTKSKAAVDQEKTALIQGRDALSNEVTALNQAHDQQAQLAAERQKDIDALTQERDQFSQQAVARQTQVESLTQAKAVVEQEKTALIQSRDALGNEVTSLNQARDQQAQLVNDRQAHIDALTQERDQLQAQLEQQDAVMVKLKDQYSESDLRQRLLNDEMFKAEAQLELIKDVLLREPGL